MSIPEFDITRAAPAARVTCLINFAAFLSQVAAIWPILPILPVNRSFAANAELVVGRLHTVEVAGSNPAAPTIESMAYGLILWLVGSIW